MKAVVKYAEPDGSVEVRDVPVPKIEPDEVLLEVKAAGICGTEIHMWHNRFKYPINLPVILGHEFCGVIAELGKEVKGFKVGERVVSETAARICGVCVYCRSGNYNLCPKRLGYGYGTDGAFTKYARVPQRILHRIPENVPFEEAALTEPVCVAYNALVVKSKINPGDTVVILGPGPIGLFSLEIAKFMGAGTIVVTGLDRDKRRFEVAEELGADIIINSEREDPVKRVLALGDSFGAHLVVDAAGFAATLNQALDMVRPNGQITKIGWDPLPVGFSLDRLVSKAATLQGVFSHTWNTWEHCLKLISLGKIKIKPLLSEIAPLTDWRRAFVAMEDKSAIKIILTPVD